MRTRSPAIRIFSLCVSTPHRRAAHPWKLSLSHSSPERIAAAFRSYYPPRYWPLDHSPFFICFCVLICMCVYFLIFLPESYRFYCSYVYAIIPLNNIHFGTVDIKRTKWRDCPLRQRLTALTKQAEHTHLAVVLLRLLFNPDYTLF